MIPGLRTYAVNASRRQPLIDFMLSGLAEAGCRVLHCSAADQAPFVISFETPASERIGIVVYAFLANRTITRNRPPDERSFQLKYGSKSIEAAENLHDLWQDPLGMFTTLLVGIDPVSGFCVSADPILHSPTRFFIRMEFKDHHAEAILDHGWFAWERMKHRSMDHTHRFETLVGARREYFLDLVRFERAVRGVDPGDRYEIATRHREALDAVVDSNVQFESLPEAGVHPLVRQFALTPNEILDLIASAGRLRMAVRGWVAEEHLRAALASRPSFTAERLDIEGAPDIRASWKGGPPLLIECKNVARTPDRHGRPRMDFQRTRAVKGDPCSRYYRPKDFDIVAGCLHGVTDQWDFRYTLPTELEPHRVCEGRLASNVRISESWSVEPEDVFQRAYAAMGGAR